MTKIVFLMDPIASVSVKKDSTLAMIAAAQKRDMEVFYLQQEICCWTRARLALTKPLRRGRLLPISRCWQLARVGMSWAPTVDGLADIDIVMMRKTRLSIWNTSTPPICQSAPRPRARWLLIDPVPCATVTRSCCDPVPAMLPPTHRQSPYGSAQGVSPGTCQCRL